MSEEVIQRVTHLVNGFDARVQAVPADCWSNQSPCTEWTAADVVGHVSGNLNGISTGLAGSAPEATGDHLADWASARESFLGAVSTADLSQPIASPMGPMPAAQFIGRLICTDVLIHTWDLARATGGDEALPADAVEGAYSGLKPMDAMIRTPGFFGAKLESPEGASTQDEFLAFVGRQV